MVIDRITDGTRIAQLLASELDGREDGGLEAVGVVNADRDVEATPSGTRAYDVVVSAGADESERDEPDDAERIGQVFVHPDRASVVLEVDPELLEAAADDVGLEVESIGEIDDGAGRPGDSTVPAVVVDDGAAVKRATNVVQRILAET